MHAFRLDVSQVKRKKSYFLLVNQTEPTPLKKRIKRELQCLREGPILHERLCFLHLELFEASGCRSKLVERNLRLWSEQTSSKPVSRRQVERLRARACARRAKTHAWRSCGYNSSKMRNVIIAAVALKSLQFKGLKYHASKRFYLSKL